MTEPTSPHTRRPAPVLLPGGDLVVPAELTAELAGALSLLAGYLGGAVPPASASLRRLTGAVAELGDAAREAAIEYRRQVARRALPGETPIVVSPGQLPPVSAEQMIATDTAADIARVSRQRIRDLVRQGRIRGRRTARNAWVVDLGDVRAYAAERMRTP